ncbi:uncharacterized protein TRIVIDRAFT_202590 [Trichoderma virens Gv29-8]|uniref:Protein kinase domain-containing protein n=1 Tax=Hypocrea virens (strain Gv29-8 / FGSC 10586) TaxID=413071 RepID=G9MXT7_HYPVG|nr:uncharacterized protein TRIVIDRAFT_202590 [Trichoderma virens Gv29-8]EHK20698.1 hypothetical protein TRIVIDRAFT_202590 [Trichoderma virens Gv29-8]UKZ56989.1 hypothetical protein TrVGV298_010838 [Trichoderma virens]
MDTKTFDVSELIGSSLWAVQCARRRSSGRSDDTNDLYAQKTIGVYENEEALLDTKENYIETAKAEFLKEVKILYHAQHQHVAKLIDAFAIEDPPQFALVMDRADENLSKCLVKKRKDLKREWFGCLLSAVDYIHGMGIRHRDIKPANILVKNGKVYLADFGISTMSIGITLSTTVPAQARARSDEYCAPEVLEGSTRGRSADIFSLGAVFLKMFVSYYLNWMKELSTALKDTQSGIASFAKKIDMVHKFMDSLPTSITALDEKDAWQPKIVAICQKMLRADRDERPKSWQLLKDLPPCCNCTETNHMELRGRLLKACKDGSVEEVKNLIKSGTDPNTVGAIQQASANGYLDIVEELLKAGASINLVDFSNQTALHCAAGLEIHGTNFWMRRWKKLRCGEVPRLQDNNLQLQK